MRCCYLVSYDITDAKRLRQVHRLLKAFGEAWQYSVFYCVLREIDRARLEVALNALIDSRADQVLIADMGAAMTMPEGASRHWEQHYQNPNQEWW